MAIDELAGIVMGGIFVVLLIVIIVAAFAKSRGQHRPKSDGSALIIGLWVIFWLSAVIYAALH